MAGKNNPQEDSGTSADTKGKGKVKWKSKKEQEKEAQAAKAKEEADRAAKEEELGFKTGNEPLSVEVCVWCKEKIGPDETRILGKCSCKGDCPAAFAEPDENGQPIRNGGRNCFHEG